MILTSILFADLMLQALIVSITPCQLRAHIDMDHVQLSQHTAFFSVSKNDSTKKIPLFFPC
jgi:hypothetical protein